MNTGGTFGFERILKFNGSFFEDATAFELPKAQLEVLYATAEGEYGRTGEKGKHLPKLTYIWQAPNCKKIYFKKDLEYKKYFIF
jgi:hypothetical protein